ncbi:hypothetical protein H2200_011436 [Cladophialophora chaetospira]|uniref:SnoaL-like domain-containing protein n=1 Tax=Cladophialophora chaetospira TaxID=386627 RepID=A0AA38WZA6_9EURO|nr:hypothetical protein H2200_011436 [Cladophialophora chaetospira]
MAEGFHTKADVLEYAQAMSDDQYDKFTAYYSPDIQLKLSSQLQLRGRQAIKEYFQKVREDMGERLDVALVVLDDNACVVREVANYLPKKDFSEGWNGLPPARVGQTIKIPIIVIYTLQEDRKVAEIEILPDGAPHVV